MNLIEKIVYKLSAEMPQPQMYGWFHIVSILLVVGTTILLVGNAETVAIKQ